MKQERKRASNIMTRFSTSLFVIALIVGVLSTIGHFMNIPQLGGVGESLKGWGAAALILATGILIRIIPSIFLKWKDE